MEKPNKKNMNETKVEGELVNRVLDAPNPERPSLPMPEREIDMGSLGGQWFTGDYNAPVSTIQYERPVPSKYF